MHLVSIVIPVKNRGDLVGETLISIQQQDYTNWEAILVDDGSEDDTESVVSQVAAGDPRIRFVKRTGSVGGAPRCRNIGVEVSKGNFVLFFDSDDLMAADCLSGRLGPFEKHLNLDFVVANGEVFRAGESSDGMVMGMDTGENDLDRFCRRDVPWTTGNVLWKRSCLEKIGPWREQLPSWQDWDYHVRALAAEATYERTGKRDWFYRLYDSSRNSIGPQSFSAEHAIEQASAVRSCTELLSEHGLLTSYRKEALAGVLFRLSIRLANAGRSQEAAKSWNVAKDLQLIGGPVLQSGFLYLRQVKSPLKKKMASFLIRLLQPSLIVHKAPALIASSNLQKR